MGIDVDSASMGRPSTSVSDPRDSPGGEKLFSGRAISGTGFCLGSCRVSRLDEGAIKALLRRY